jgi:uroporphyrinogen III methyltransferase/synthase
MGMRNLEKIVATLIGHGRPPGTPAAVVMEGATPRQRVVEAPLEELPGAVRRAGLGAPAVIVVGEVVQLRSELAWAEGRPLFGRRVLVTRPADPDDALAQGLRDAGAEVQHRPLFEIVPVAASAAVDAALRPSVPYDAVFFTSRNAVLQTEVHLGRLGVTPSELAASTLCVGRATAATARSVGFAEIAVPEHARDAETLARWWVKQSDRRGWRCVFPRAAVVAGALPELLRDGGVELVEVVVYQSSPVHRGTAVQDLSGFDAIAFASASAAQAFVEAGGEAGGAVLSAIGERTAATLASLGTPAQVVARHPEAQSLVDALARYFEERDA